MLSDQVDRKFIDSLELSDDWEIESDSGWQPITHIYKTVEYTEWEVETETGKYLKAADTHILFDENFNEIYVKDCIENVTFIQTKSGIEKVIRVKELLTCSNMFDVSVDSNDHRFYTNDILSHNSTTVIMYVLWMILFQDFQSVLVLAHNGGQAKKTLAALKLAYENLPMWIQQGVIEWNKGSVELENGSKVVSCATGSSAARGGSYSAVLLDEFAFVRPNIAEEFFKSVYPTISSGKTTKLFIISTPNGHNHFWKIFNAAEKGLNDFKPFTAYWWQVPWKNDAWREAEIRNMGSVEAFEQEHGVEFHGAENTLIPQNMLAQKYQHRDAIRTSQNLKIYYEVEKEHQYILTVDVSKGVDKDYSTITVFDVTMIPYKQVACYRSNTIDPMILPTIVYDIGMTYNEAFTLIENNDVGSQVTTILHSDLEYSNIFWSKKDKNTKVALCFGGQRSELGLRTTKSVKLIGSTTLKTLFSADKLILHDYDTFQELTNFVANNGSYSASDGNTDDLAMNLVLFAWCTRQKVFEHVSENDVRPIIEKEQAEVMPFGFKSSGLDTSLSNKDATNLLYSLVPYKS